jgi:putative peptidoglycan binding protein
MTVPYLNLPKPLAKDAANDPALVRALQRDLRSLGYLRGGIDGEFGEGTLQAVQGLQFDLLNNSGESHKDDGRAPVALMDFNLDPADSRTRLVGQVTGVVDDATARCLDRMLADPRVAKLPNSGDPVTANRRAMVAIAGFPSPVAPSPFIAAIVRQESNAQHYHAAPNDEDQFVVVGLDHGNKNAPEQITSRGFGIGQYTVFHYPPRADEVNTFIVDPLNNVQQAFRGLRDKFDHFVVDPKEGADDRKAEHPTLPLRLCVYKASDARYLRDCRNCAVSARKLDIYPGTPVYAGATLKYEPDQYYASATHLGVPDRADFPCDWPYAARRYNGAGNDSYHYQARVLMNLLLPAE